MPLSGEGSVSRDGRRFVAGSRSVEFLLVTNVGLGYSRFGAHGSNVGSGVTITPAIGAEPGTLSVRTVRIERL